MFAIINVLGDQMGGVTVAAANDPFKRHVFTTTVRLVNPSARREMP